MATQEAKVEELVSMIERGELRLPEMQRHYVWRATRVRDLFDSLYRGYPSGTILIWDTDEDVPGREMSVDQRENAYSNTRLLLDGQQRLTSLLAVTRGSQVTVRGRKKPIDILFNLNHPERVDLVTEVHEQGSNQDDPISDEEDSTSDDLQKRLDRMTFVVATKKLAKLPYWVKVTDVFQNDDNREFLQHAGVTDFDDQNYERFNKRLTKLRGIRNYQYRMDVLERSLSYEEVTEIFVRVNSLGTKLRSSDLALAQITAKWRNSLVDFLGFQNKCHQESGFNLDLGIYIRNLVVFITGQARFNTVGKLSIESLKKGWEECCEGLEFALNFLKGNAGIEDTALLSSPFMLITVAYYGHKCGYKLGQEEEKKLRYWILVANAKGRYSRGSSETLLEQDITALKKNNSAEELIALLHRQVGRLEISPQDLEGRNQRSALFKTMFLAFRAAGAKDWKNKVQIALNHQGNQNKLQFHHVFPKHILKNKYDRREVDDIANLSFIAKKTNRAIWTDEPTKYFKEIVNKDGNAPFEAQCIPVEAELLKIENYKDFLQKRREMIAARLNDFLEN